MHILPKIKMPHLSKRKLVAVSVVVVSALQLGLFSFFVVPGTKINNKIYYFGSVASVSSNITADANSIQKSIRFDGNTLEVAAADMGVAVDQNDSKAAVTAPLWSRVIPGAPFAHALLKNRTLEYKLDPEKATVFADNFVQKHSIGPKDASLTIISNTATISPESRGYNFEKKDLLDAATQAVTTSSVTLRALVEEPARTTVDIEQLATNINAMLQKQKAIYIDEVLVTDVTAEKFAEWVRVTEDENKNIVVGVHTERVEAYASDLAPKVNTEASVTTVFMEDGVEIRRTQGNQGKKLDTKALVDAVSLVIATTSTDDIKAKSSAILSPVVVERSYTDSQNGFTARMDYLLSGSYPGYSVSVVGVAGTNYTYGYKSDKQYYAASLFKLFSAQMLMNSIEDGAASWTDDVGSGQTADACFTAMLVQSEDACAHKITNHLGGKEVVNSWIGEQGYGSSAYLPTYTTSAKNMTTYFSRLHYGTLVNTVHAAKLNQALETQVFREGMPAGVKGGSVADKVGILDPYLHDAGLIRIKDRVYSVAILSNGGTWKGIKDITEHIVTYGY